jgi:hypothetical protein
MLPVSGKFDFIMLTVTTCDGLEERAEVAVPYLPSELTMRRCDFACVRPVRLLRFVSDVHSVNSLNDDETALDDQWNIPKLEPSTENCMDPVDGRLLRIKLLRDWWPSDNAAVIVPTWEETEIMVLLETPRLFPAERCTAVSEIHNVASVAELPNFPMTVNPDRPILLPINVRLALPDEG